MVLDITNEETRNGRKNEMTNEELYKTAAERKEAFKAFCRYRVCEECPCCDPEDGYEQCVLRWLEREVEVEKD